MQSSVKARLQAFLPEIAQANEALDARLAAGQGACALRVPLGAWGVVPGASFTRVYHWID